jgi:hypothetical protein
MAAELFGKEFFHKGQRLFDDVHEIPPFLYHSIAPAESKSAEQDRRFWKSKKL